MNAHDSEYLEPNKQFLGSTFPASAPLWGVVISMDKEKRNHEEIKRERERASDMPTFYLKPLPQRVDPSKAWKR